jgi:hypothetical protein
VKDGMLVLTSSSETGFSEGTHALKKTKEIEERLNIKLLLNDSK